MVVYCDGHCEIGGKLQECWCPSYRNAISCTARGANTMTLPYALVLLGAHAAPTTVVGGSMVDITKIVVVRLFWPISGS